MIKDKTADGRGAWRQVAQGEYAPVTGRELTTAVALTVADAAGVEPTEFEAGPLYESVDLSAVEAVLFGSGSATPSNAARVSFRYDGYRVVVDADGRITVSEPTA